MTMDAAPDVVTDAETDALGEVSMVGHARLKQRKDEQAKRRLTKGIFVVLAMLVLSCAGNIGLVYAVVTRTKDQDTGGLKIDLLRQRLRDASAVVSGSNKLCNASAELQTCSAPVHCACEDFCRGACFACGCAPCTAATWSNSTAAARSAPTRGRLAPDYCAPSTQAAGHPPPMPAARSMARTVPFLPARATARSSRYRPQSPRSSNPYLASLTNARLLASRRLSDA